MPFNRRAVERPSPPQHENPDTTSAWAVVLAISDFARRGNSPGRAGTYAVDRDGHLTQGDKGVTGALVRWEPGQGWLPVQGLPAEVRDLLDLYLPVCARSHRDPLAIGHLGQSLDGCIATKSGDSCHVTGRENILHLHRMRALCDAVVVGAETVACDDPRLTTRLAPGSNPVRVVLDPRRRLSAQLRVFADGEAPTLLLCSAEQDGARSQRLGQAEVVGVPSDGPHGRLRLHDVLRELHRRGLRRLFIEGGGVTVSAFLRAGLLDRLQVAVAPVIIGDGRRGLQLPPAGGMGDCQRPRCRVFSMGEDVLFDCEPRRGEGRPDDAGMHRPVRRIS